MSAATRDATAGGAARGGAEFHVFVVHSAIAHDVARAVIAAERLAPERVVLLCARGMEPAAAGFARIPLAIETARESPRAAREVWRAWRWMRAIDHRLAEATQGRPFHFYTPHTLERAFQVIRSHRGCVGFSFLEEGLYSYCTRAEIDRVLPPLRVRRGDRLAFRGRVRAARFFEEGHTRAYGIDAAVFPDLARRMVLQDAIPADAEGGAGVTHLIAFDALSATRQVRVESVCAALDRLLLRLLAEGASRVHYKLHPAQLGHPEVAALAAALGRHAPALTAERLPDALGLERLARARPTIRFYVNLSSAGFYAALAGCQAFSFAPFVAEAEPGFARVMERVPRAFRERVRFLDEEPDA